jgi:hypothetical protein
MGETTTIANLGDLAMPATALVEKVSEAVGGIFRPYQIVRVAKAVAEAKKIEAMADVEVTEIQQRGIARLIIEEGKKQENIESITAQAIPLLEDGAKPEEMENDWITNFFDKCKLISDQEMQSLWSKLLAGEANKAGTFSKRTIELVSQLDKADAQLFTIFCSFAFVTGRITPFIFDVKGKVYTEKGLNFEKLSHLDNIGLINFNHVTGFIQHPYQQESLVHYYGTPIYIRFPNEKDNVLQLGHVVLTKIGHELAPLCGSERLDSFLEYVIEKWISAGLKVWSPFPAHPDSASSTKPHTQ